MARRQSNPPIPRQFNELQTDYGLPMHDRWLVRTFPYDDESLASWLARQSATLGCAIPDLLRHLEQFAEHRVGCLNRDIDLAAGPMLLSKLTEMSGLHPARIGRLPAGMVLGNTPEARRILKRWLRLQHDHDGRYPATQLCVRCLQTPPAPFLRQDWRFAWNITCPIHHCALLEACPTCGKGFQVAVTAVPALLELRCPNCRADLHVINNPTAPELAPETASLQQTISRALRSGRWLPKQGQFNTSLGFIAFVDALFPLLVAKSIGNTEHFFEISNRAPLLSTSRLDRSAAGAEWTFRHDILRMIGHLLDFWPVRLMRIAGEYQFSIPWHPWNTHRVFERRSEYNVKDQQLYVDHLFRCLGYPMTFQKVQGKRDRNPRLKGDERLRHAHLGIRD